MISISLSGLVVEVQSVDDALAFFGGLTSTPVPGLRVVARRQTAVPQAPVEVDAQVLPHADALQVQRLIAPRRPPRRRSPLVEAIAAEIEAASVTVVEAEAPPISPNPPPELPAPRRPRRASAGRAPRPSSTRTWDECAEMVLAAFRRNQAYEIPRLAADVFGDTELSSVRRMHLMIARLVAQKRLTRLGSMTYLVPTPELEDDDVLGGDDDVAGEPIDDEDDDLPRSLKDADTFGEDDDAGTEDDEVEPAELAFD